ncbi:MAG: FAD-dependent monooxygenase [Okeania sp. SIO3I5]|uniref:FAD-dependent oxidoreductase n=1 Tax=Okeania sp. SIO3I5 TaxID=2607805 RepID=UPI0013B669A2|nr:NAD(P)/FAD-dependent oxidoreductase [Okeania sp. SIO3I5]NEQ35821.1 FAD-dependent monooxygenase [Okeania sp. SIO3I5]
MKPENSNPRIDYDVAIVGAGPVGLATALGLRQRGIENIIVLDQTRAFRKVGQGLGLLPNGLKALKYIAPQAYNNIKATIGQPNNSLQTGQKNEVEKKQPSPEWHHVNVKGQQIRSYSMGYDEWFQQYGEGRISISWYDLQTQLRTLLPVERVKANHRCINVVTEPEFQCVRADFVSNQEVGTNPYAHWDEQQEKNQSNTVNSSQFPESEITSIRAKLLIAADGINSSVRQIIYKNTAYSRYSQPEYCGVGAIGSSGTYQIPEALAQEIKERFFHGSPRVVTITNHESDVPRIILFSPQPSQFGYLLHAAFPLESLLEKSGEELINIAVEELKKADFPEMVQQLVALSSPDKMIQRPYYTHHATVSAPEQPKWNMERVVLAGDAAHGMPPFIGQGANQGLEDAAAIATLVAEISNQNQWDDVRAIEAAFSKYEALRRPFVTYIQEETLIGKPFFSSDEKLRKYNQRVLSRNIEEIMQTFQ